MPRTSPAGSTAQLCIRCYPRCPWAPRPRLSPTSPAFPPAAPAKLGEVTWREAPAEGAAGAGGAVRGPGAAAPRRGAEGGGGCSAAPTPAPGVSPSPARAVPGLNRRIPPPSPFFNLSAPAPPTSYLGGGSPETRSREMREAPEVCRGREGADAAGIKARGVCGPQFAQPRRRKLTCSV